MNCGSNGNDADGGGQRSTMRLIPLVAGVSNCLSCCCCLPYCDLGVLLGSAKTGNFSPNCFLAVLAGGVSGTWRRDSRGVAGFSIFQVLLGEILCGERLAEVAEKVLC